MLKSTLYHSDKQAAARVSAILKSLPRIQITMYRRLIVAAKMSTMQRCNDLLI